MKNIILSVLITQCLFGLEVFATKPGPETFNMHSDECRVFFTKGKSRISVPSGCFSYNEKTYSGPVIIKFTEYKDQVDFIRAGLTLRYDFGGKLHTLQSGGMFKIEAFNASTGLPLQCLNGKKITVKFAIDPRFNTAGLEPFYFDPGSEKWIKMTRFANSSQGNTIVSEDNSSLWQDDPRSIIDEISGNSGDDISGTDCYTIQIPSADDPSLFIDTLICPEVTNILDSRYSAYLSDQNFKTMQIDRMGLFNYDKIFDDENSVPLFVKLKEKTGTELRLTGTLYVVYKTSNSVIYYQNDDLAEKFSLIPRNDIRLFIINEDGSMLKVPDSFWESLNIRSLRGKTIELTFEKVTPATLSKEDFAKATGLQG